ncbi:MAG: helix-turn-helix domain-containing protein [Clostridiales bacterium]|nr:helix-turn-helix domain-containing protein [Clostridiales bacterium]
MSQQTELGWSLIPPHILSNKNITSSAKLVWGRIKGLEGQKGYCWASNAHIGENLSLKKNTVTKKVKELIDEDLVQRRLIRDNDGLVTERRLWTTGHSEIPNTTPSPTNDQDPSPTNDQEVPDKHPSREVDKRGRGKENNSNYVYELNKPISEWNARDFTKYLVNEYYRRFEIKIDPNWEYNGKTFKRLLNNVVDSPNDIKECLDRLFDENGMDVNSATWVKNSINDYLKEKKKEERKQEEISKKTLN